VCDLQLDGIAADYLQFNAWIRVEIAVAERHGYLTMRGGWEREAREEQFRETNREGEMVILIKAGRSGWAWVE